MQQFSMIFYVVATMAATATSAFMMNPTKTKHPAINKPAFKSLHAASNDPDSANRRPFSVDDADDPRGILILQEETSFPANSVATTSDPSVLNKQERKPVVRPKSAKQHNQGALSPLVLGAKVVLGSERLNKLRGRAIALHSDVIGYFVETSDTSVGRTVLAALFNVADRDRSGAIEENELAAAFDRLGFVWLKNKQVQGILARADADGNGSIDLSEWMKEAPKTLRTNLIKLAKKNGGELGLLV